MRYRNAFTWFSKVFLVLALPASTNYQLKDFGLGGGGGSAASGSYSVHGISGEVSGGTLTGNDYKLGSGLEFTQQSNVPPAPTFTNPANHYNKLKLVINNAGNASDTRFAIAISTDNFASDTRYVQNDGTVGSSLGSEDYQTYANWGGGSGVFVIGLTPGTTYTVKVKAMQGGFTETGYGPTAQAATVNSTLTFDIDVSASDTDTSPPFSLNFGDLIANTVTNSPQKVWVDFSTNGESGGRVYIVGQNAGLSSAHSGYTIESISGNLASASHGFGAQGYSVTQDSGGPFTIATLYDVSGDNIGITDQSIREIFVSGNPTINGRGAFLLKAKSSQVTPAAGDYQETLTMIASASF